MTKKTRVLIVSSHVCTFFPEGDQDTLVATSGLVGVRKGVSSEISFAALVFVTSHKVARPSRAVTRRDCAIPSLVKIKNEASGLKWACF